MRPPNPLGEPRLVQLLDGTEDPDWRTAYGGTLNPTTGKVELPTPAYKNCPECAREATRGHR
ncbi:hypothetical protein [Streptomyces acidiscabies]|uniref:Uncharacterized protein n=1 Tax=Streptomyces acidiscabies TaxID=42234 RepID=A0AAP6BGM4_9ACTN|nr:hypothetical protein [Streptomyces acidiscabies]MBP5937434.1 hypothetical protein [Streptomyces sp. LBUM 1476]MBZ3914491.1 hypothetical protein [Streptomyces acidiscabies]MDX2964359.1 hypothetical protein [Streptomyces acidiscabies]MDX3017180.1 hypothetical protein [Streptomyces acidiscabies]MDX3789131.1 hypothetical protein [Streptomyces acidiscabies]